MLREENFVRKYFDSKVSVDGHDRHWTGGFGQRKFSRDKPNREDGRRSKYRIERENRDNFFVFFFNWRKFSNNRRRNATFDLRRRRFSRFDRRSVSHRHRFERKNRWNQRSRNLSNSKIRFYPNFDTKQTSYRKSSPILFFRHFSFSINDLSCFFSSKVKCNQKYLSMIEQVLKTDAFYYSYSYDISHTFQRLQTSPPEFQTAPLIERADPRFVWNRSLLNVLLKNQRTVQFALPIIHGCKEKEKTFFIFIWRTFGSTENYRKKFHSVESILRIAETTFIDRLSASVENYCWTNIKRRSSIWVFFRKWGRVQTSSSFLLSKSKFIDWEWLSAERWVWRS